MSHESARQKRNRRRARRHQREVTKARNVIENGSDAKAPEVDEAYVAFVHPSLEHDLRELREEERRHWKRR